MTSRNLLLVPVCCLLLATLARPQSDDDPKPCSGKVIVVRTTTICNHLLAGPQSFFMSQDEKMARENFIKDVKALSIIRGNIRQLLDTAVTLKEPERERLVSELHSMIGTIRARNDGFLEMRLPQVDNGLVQESNDVSDLNATQEALPAWVYAKQISFSAAGGMEYPRGLLLADAIVDRICIRNHYTTCKEPRRSFLHFWRRWKRSEKKP